MTPETFFFLLIGGLTNGAIYALVALGLVLIHEVTRVVNIMQGEFVTLGALSTVSLLLGKLPASFGLGLLLGGLWLGAELWRRYGVARGLPSMLLLGAGGVGLYLLLARTLEGNPVPYLLAALLSIALVAGLGAATYRFAIQTVPDRSDPLIYLIITTGLFIFVEGFALIVWGSQGSNLPSVASGALTLGPLVLPWQRLFILIATTVAVIAFYLFLERSLLGKALRATAVNRLGARLVGIKPARAGLLAWSLSAGLCALAGILIAPIIIVNFNTGLPLGLKGFIAAVISGFASFPGAVVGGLVVGLLESAARYFNSSFAEIIVYSLLFVILLARVLRFPARRRRPEKRARAAVGGD